MTDLELAKICQQSHVSVMGHNMPKHSGNRNALGDPLLSFPPVLFDLCIGFRQLGAEQLAAG